MQSAGSREYIAISSLPDNLPDLEAKIHTNEDAGDDKEAAKDNVDGTVVCVLDVGSVGQDHADSRS